VLVLGLLAAAGASVAYNVGIVLQAADAQREPAAEGLRLSLLSHLARRRRWIAGFLLGGLGFALQVAALSLAPFVVVQPVLDDGLLLMLYLGVRMLYERVGAAEVIGVVGITAGIGLLAWGTPTGNETVTSPAAALVVMGTMTAISLIPFALRGRGRLDTSTLVIVASALAFGASNLATKLVSDAGAGSAWIVAGAWLLAAALTGLIALVTEMTALQRTPATFVVPLSFAIQTFLPVLLEPIYLTERWGTAALGGVPLVTGLAMVCLGAVAVAKTQAVSSLIAAEPPPV
jgi:drug/metabolite transporter (DMT)-like permease